MPFTSLTPGDIKLFKMQLPTVSGRRVENTAARQPNNMSIAASPDHQSTGEMAEQSIAEVILQQWFLNDVLAIIVFFHLGKNFHHGSPFIWRTQFYGYFHVYSFKLTQRHILGRAQHPCRP